MPSSTASTFGAVSAIRRLISSSTLGKASSSRPSKAAQGTVRDLRKLVEDLEDRARGGPGKRQAAATRKLKAAARSTAAKKAARTRAKKS
jgi:hypothetical protein